MSRPDSRWIFLLVLLTIAGPQILLAADRPPLLGVAHISIAVTDAAKARAFYGGLLGYEESFSLKESDGSAPLLYFKVNNRQYFEISPTLPPGQDERLRHIAFETTEVETLRLYLAEKGVKVPEKVRADVDGSLSIVVTDPDGHLVKFVQYRTGSLQAKGDSLSPRRISDRLLHVGITVTDPAKADRFYKDILGFSEFWRGGSTEGQTNWINMRLPESTDYMEYMLVTGPLNRGRLGSAHHACLLVTDMQKAMETLRERPGGWELKPPSVGRNNRWLMNLFDPDGTRTELMEPHTVR